MFPLLDEGTLFLCWILTDCLAHRPVLPLTPLKEGAIALFNTVLLPAEPPFGSRNGHSRCAERATPNAPRRPLRYLSYNSTVSVPACSPVCYHSGDRPRAGAGGLDEGGKAGFDLTE